MENPKENLIQESTKSAEKSREGFKMTTEQAGQITAELSKLNDAIVHDKAISTDDIEDLSKVARGGKIDVGGEIMTVEEAEKIPDLKMNAEVWKEIKNGNFDGVFFLTFITDEIAKLLVKKFDNYQTLKLWSLRSLSDNAAEVLSKHRGNLHIDNVENLSDNAAMSLARHEGTVF